jgi:hypothetical protein
MNTSHPSVTEIARDRLDRDPQAEAGFSRVDLVTLIVTLTLLALLLAPALAHTRLNDRAFQCRNNLGRLLNAWRMYAEDNSDKVPSAWRNAGDWWPGGDMSWTGRAATDGGNPYNWNPEITVKRSPLWPYCGGSLDIWRCPGDSIYSCLANGQSLPRVRSYSMNAWFNGADAQQVGGSGFTVYTKVGNCLMPGPAMTFVFTHERVDSINDGEFLLSMSGYPGQPQSWRLIDLPTNLHEGACGFSFVDGHTEMHRWRDMALTIPMGHGPNSLAPNSNDASWLMDHSTRKP